MILRGILAESESLIELLETARNGDVIEICEMNGLSAISCAHPEGVVIQRDQQLLLNGVRELGILDAHFDDWSISSNGVIVCKKDREFYTIEGNHICSFDSCILRWVIHPDGILAETELGEIILNGRLSFYSGNCDDWTIDTDGKLFVLDGRNIRQSNGDVVFEHLTPKYVLVLNKHIIIVSENDFLIDNGTKVLLHSEWDYCDANDHGLYIWRDDKIFLHVFHL